MSDKASANEASSKANPAQNPTKPSDKARADNAPLDLHSEGAKMFFYIQVAFSEGGQMWCSASYVECLWLSVAATHYNIMKNTIVAAIVIVVNVSCLTSKV